MAANVEPFADDQGHTPVRGYLHRPAGRLSDALVLTHGAGSNCNAPLLVGVADAFCDAGWTVLRCDLPYRQAHPHGPPRGSGAEDREGLRRAVEVCRKLVPGRVFLGGHSYGGRQATMLAAEDPTLTDGLLILSYPLHPPKKPTQLRTSHLPSVRTPALFVSGSNDSFASRAEIEAAVKLVPGRTSLLILECAGHDLGWGRRAAARDLPLRIVRVFGDLFPAP